MTDDLPTFGYPTKPTEDILFVHSQTTELSKERKHSAFTERIAHRRVESNRGILETVCNHLLVTQAGTKSTLFKRRIMCLCLFIVHFEMLLEMVTSRSHGITNVEHLNDDVR